MNFDQKLADLIAEKNTEIVRLTALLPPRPGPDQDWRVGNKVPVNLYCGGRIAGQMQSPGLAAHVVQAVNGIDQARDIARELWGLFDHPEYEGSGVPPWLADRIHTDPALFWLRGEEQPPGTWTPKETEQP